MADNTLGSGYLDSAKPFNVINPTGIDPGQAVDILKEVSENAKNRAFQAQEGARDRSAKARMAQQELAARSQMAQQELAARSQSEDKERASRENLTREQMKQQQGQFDAEQAAQQLQHNQEMELNRQQFQSQEAERKRRATIEALSEKHAIRARRTQIEIGRQLGGLNDFASGPPNPGGRAGTGEGGSAPSMGGDVLGVLGSGVFDEEKRQELFKKYNETLDQDVADQRTAASLVFLEQLADSNWMASTTPDGTSIPSVFVRKLDERGKARIKMDSDIQAALEPVVQNYLTKPTFVGEESWLSVPGRALRASLPGYSVAGKTAANAIMPGLGELIQPEGQGDSFQERYEADKWTQAGLEPPPPEKTRLKTLAGEIAKTISPKDTVHATVQVEGLLESLSNAVATSGRERQAHLNDAKAAYKALTAGGLADPESLDHAMKQVYTLADKKVSETNMNMVRENAEDPPIEGKARLSWAEKAKVGQKEAAEAKRLRDMMQTFATMTDDELGKDGAPTGNQVALVKHWVTGRESVKQGSQEMEAVLEAVSALGQTKDPLTIMSLLADDDDANDMGPPEVLAAFKKMPKDFKQILYDAVKERNFSVVEAARHRGVNLENFMPGAIREEAERIQKESAKRRFKADSEIRLEGSKAAKSKREAAYSAEEKMLNEDEQEIDRVYGEFLGGKR